MKLRNLALLVVPLLLLSGCGLDELHSAAYPQVDTYDSASSLTPTTTRSHRYRFDATIPTTTRSRRALEDSKISHNSEDWLWLKSSKFVTPGSFILNKTKDTSCSTGWIVGADDRNFILTAGHCGDRGDEFYLPDGETYIGQMVESMYVEAGGADYGLIELSANAPVNSSPQFKDLKLLGWRGYDWIEENDPRICHLGYRTGLSCGDYLEITPGGNVTFRGFSDHGDSGGPVFALTDEGIYAVGVLSGSGIGDASRIYGMAIQPPMQRWGLTIYN